MKYTVTDLETNKEIEISEEAFYAVVGLRERRDVRIANLEAEVERLNALCKEMSKGFKSEINESTEGIRAVAKRNAAEVGRLKSEKEELLVHIQNSRNFLLGMSMDTAIPPYVKEAVKCKAAELDEVLDEYSAGT